MRADTLQHDICMDNLDVSIQILAHMEPTHSMFISCYLDLRMGLSQAQSYLASQKYDNAHQLEESERHDYEQAIDSIAHELDEIKPDCKGLALFYRSYHGGHFDCMLEFDIPVSNHISVSAVPDIMPLVMMQHEQGWFLQASVRDSAIDIYESRLGVRTLRGMAPIPASSSDESKVAIASHMLERTMRASPELDVIIDGDSEFIHAVYNTMPRLLRRRVIQLLPRHSRDDDQKLKAIGQLTHKRYREHQSSDRLYDEIKSSLSLENMSTGIMGTLQAIMSDSVNSIYVAADDLKRTIRPQLASEQRNGVLEIVRLAIQQDIPIEFVRSSKMMQRADGIACMLSNESFMHVPESAPSPAVYGMAS